MEEIEHMIADKVEYTTDSGSSSRNDDCNQEILDSGKKLNIN